MLGVHRVVGRRRAHAQGDPHASVGVGDGAAAHQAVRVGDVDALLGVQAEDAAVEEGRLVEVVPGLGEGEMVDAVDDWGPGLVGDVREVGTPVGQFGPLGRAEEEFRAVGCRDRVERGVRQGTAPGQHGGQEGLGAAGGAGRVG